MCSLLHTRRRFLSLQFYVLLIAESDSITTLYPRMLSLSLHLFFRISSSFFCNRSSSSFTRGSTYDCSRYTPKNTPVARNSGAGFRDRNDPSSELTIFPRTIAHPSPHHHHPSLLFPLPLNELYSLPRSVSSQRSLAGAMPAPIRAPRFPSARP